jgi:competence protein ComEC
MCLVERIFLVLMMGLLAACPAPRKPPIKPLPPGGTDTLGWVHVTGTAGIPDEPPAAGTYRIHLIDVGTGLSILIQGADFTMLYDAGSNDREEQPTRVIEYLRAAIGPSGDDLCAGGADKGARLAIDHVVLSHPHFDHASALDLVLHCYEVHSFWDSGRIHPTVFYRELVAAISAAAGLVYHTAADVPASHEVTVKEATVRIPTWERFSDGDVVKLGAGAQFTILHAEGKPLKDPNQNSVVLAVQLGRARLLLVGDAESGDRKDPSYPPGDVEEYLIDHHKAEIRSDILQVGHHGSKTSSRRAFLEAVHASLALVSSGPKRYGKTVLPDREVIDELKAQGMTILRTDEHDDVCADGPGGCDSWVITIKP